MTDLTVLKPCPACGCDAHAFSKPRWHKIGCDVADCVSTGWRESVGDAATIWNSLPRRGDEKSLPLDPDLRDALLKMVLAEYDREAKQRENYRLHLAACTMNGLLAGNWSDKPADLAKSAVEMVNALLKELGL